MRLLQCVREDEVRELLRQGHWPEASPVDVREHVAECGGCADLVRLTVGFRASREASAAQARMMSPGLIWWRAQLRRRQQAMEDVARPIRQAQVFAVVVSLCVGGGLAAWFGQNGSWRAWMASMASIGESLRLLGGGRGTLFLGVGILVLLGVGLLTLWSSADVD